VSHTQALRPGIHCLHMRVNFLNLQGKHYTVIVLSVTIMYDDKQMFGIPLTAKFDHGSIKRMVCHSSCPELAECVSYTLDITLKAEQTALCYGSCLQPLRCVCVATYWLWKECVIKSCHSSWSI